VERLARGRVHYPHGAGDQLVVRRRLAFAGALLVLVTVGGTLGYHRMGQGQWSLQDCAYMVIITLTSVGYAEVLPLQDVEGGRLFTMALLVGGTGMSLYFLSALTAFIIEGDLRAALWRRKMERKLSELTGHFVVCGAGRTGRYVVDELVETGTTVVVVERREAELDVLVAKHGETIVAILGDATDDAVLRDAGVARATGLVAALQEDQDNLFVALSARQLNPNLRIVSRANAERVEPKLRLAGADAVVSPTHIGGHRMAHELLRPNVVGFLDLMSRGLRRNLDIEQIEIPAGSKLDGRTLARSQIREVSSALVLAVLHDGEQHYNPPSDFELRAGMTLVLLGEVDQIARLQDYVRSRIPNV
jgi:voltage-gated potassium channel